MRVNIDVMKRDLEKLTDQLLLEMNGRKDAIPVANCPFSCKNIKGSLLQHLDEEHSKDLAFVCSECNDSITGGLKQFIIHQKSFHPEKSTTDLLGSVNDSSNGVLRPKKCKKPSFKAICPYCKFPIRLSTENALRSHLESLHESSLESEVHEITASTRFMAADRSTEPERKRPISDEERNDLESESCDESPKTKTKLGRRRKRKKIKSKS